MKTTKALFAFLLLSATALTAEPRPIVSVRVPYAPGKPGTWTNADQPTVQQQDVTGLAIWNKYQRSNLVLIQPDGREELLVDAGDGAVIDPNLDSQAEWVYYAKTQGAVFQGFDIFKKNLATKEEIRLTNHEWTPPRSIAYGSTWDTGAVKGHPPSNICPCVIGDRVFFCSNRDNLRTNGQRRGSDQCFLIYCMDTDGKNVERIGAWHLGGALHVEKHPSGRVFFSTNEKMGYRSAMAWGLWAYWPDGTGFEPFVSSYSGTPLHGHCSLPDGRIAFTNYYSTRNGVGTILACNPFPQGSPAAPPRFGFPPGPQGEIIPSKMGYAEGVGTTVFRQHFSTAETISLTPFAHQQDASATVLEGIRQGFVAFPAAAPNGLLMTWTGGEAMAVNNTDWQGRGRIVRLANNKPVSRAAGLIPVFENPNYSYIQSKPVVSDAALYGQEIPKRPWIENDGSKCPAYLPNGSPFAIVGSASTISKELMQWAYGTTGGQIPKTIKDDEIRYVRIYYQRPSPVGHVPFDAFVRERLEIACDIPVRHPKADGTEPIDSDGNPDTSWLAKILGDTTFTLAGLNEAKEQLFIARTWHGLRPGEVRVDCGGCHKHTKGATNWESTLAFRHLNGTADAPFTVADGTKSRAIQLERDVQPTLTALGLTATISTAVDGQELAPNNVFPGRSLRSPLYTSLVATPAQKELIAAWIDAGAGRGSGMLADDLRPVLTVQEPSREQRTPITAIRFGAYDLHSGVGKVSVKASFVVEGRGPGSELADLFTTMEQVWSLAIPAQASGEVTVAVTDKAGNAESLTRTLKIANPNQVEIDALNLERAGLMIRINADTARLAEIEARLKELGK